MTHHCPRCELRFVHDSEMLQHLNLDHSVDTEQLERYRYPARTADDESAHDDRAAAGRRYLVVANRTLAGEALRAAIRERAAAGPARFYVLAPATHSLDYDRAEPSPEAIDRGISDDRGVALARWRLRTLIEDLAADGITVEGAIGHPDPFEAVRRLWRQRTFDEVIMSTLPEGASHWLSADLPRRIERRFNVPVTTVVAEAAARGAGRATT